MSETAEVTIESSSLQPGPKQLKERQEGKEGEKTPKQRLLEALRPDEKTKGEIKTIVTEATVDMMEGKSDEERSRIEVGTKIFLWQLLVNDTGSELPEGLAINGGWKSKEPDLSEIFIGFDQAIITRDQYLKVVKNFQEKDVLKKVIELQQQYREQNRGKLVETMNDFLLASPLTDYFASFSVGERPRSPRDLNADEAAALTATLQGEFALQLGIDPHKVDEEVKFGPHALRKAHKQNVAGPVFMATVDKAADHANSAQEAAALERFRQHVLLNCFGKSGTPAERVSVKDGHFYVAFYMPAPEMLPVKDGGNWGNLATDEIEKVDNTPNKENWYWPGRALQVIGPRLYESTDGYQNIIDQGIADSADMFVEELIQDNFFDRGMYYVEESSNHPSIVAWLTGATSPIVQNDDMGRWVDSIGRIQKYDLEAPLEREKREYFRVLSTGEIELYRDYHMGEVLWADDAIFADSLGRLITNNWHDNDLPTVITPELEETAHLRARVLDPRLATDTMDMGLKGMKLIAREGDDHLFVLDKDNPVYRRIEDPIPDNVRDRLIDECRSIWMDGLADDLESGTELTTSKVIDLAANYAVYWAPKEGQPTIEVESLSDFAEQGLVDDQGKLHGQCQHFEFFVRKLCNIIYGYNSRRVHKLGGKYTLTSSRYIDAQGHAQTGVVVPEKGIDAIIDLEPYLDKIEADWDYVPSPKKVRPRTLQGAGDFSASSQHKSASGDALDQAIVKAQELAEVNGALAIFAMDLTSYLGVKNSFEHTEWGFDQWKQDVLTKLGPDIGKDVESWGNKPHILLYTLLRQYKEGSAIAPEDITRVRSILYKYKEHAAGGQRRMSRADYIAKIKGELGEKYDSLYRFVEPTQPQSFDELIGQGVMPNYDDNFLQHMEQMLEGLARVQKS